MLFFRPRAERDSEEFYADSRYGELWVGVRPTLEEIAALTGLEARHLDELLDAIRKDVGEGGLGRPRGPDADDRWTRSSTRRAGCRRRTSGSRTPSSPAR